MEFAVINRNRNNKWVTLAQELYKIQLQRKEMEKKEDLLMSELKSLSKNNPAQGGGYLFSISFRKGSIEYTKIPALQNMDLEPYRKEQVACWKLSKVVGN